MRDRDDVIRNSQLNGERTKIWDIEREWQKYGYIKTANFYLLAAANYIIADLALREGKNDWFSGHFFDCVLPIIKLISKTKILFLCKFCKLSHAKWLKFHIFSILVNPKYSISHFPLEISHAIFLFFSNFCLSMHHIAFTMIINFKNENNFKRI